MVARHIWGNFQPWVEDDIRQLNACLPVGVREGPYIGLHIRRGDKLAHEADLTPAKDYLTVAVSALLRRSEECTGAEQLRLDDECQMGTPLLPEHIKGIFVASDDGLVAEEIRELTPMFLPNVKAENVVYMSDGKVSSSLVPRPVHDLDVNSDYPLRMSTRPRPFGSASAFSWYDFTLVEPVVTRSNCVRLHPLPAGWPVKKAIGRA